MTTTAGAGTAASASPSDGDRWRPLVLDADPEASSATLRAVLDDPGLTVLDQRAAQLDDLARVRATVPGSAANHPGFWVHYPWRRTVVGLLGPEALRLLRLDRNRNKITPEEQRRLAGLRVGVVGLSVGHAVAHTLALEGLCGELRLADFDAVEVSNLNRIPATLFDLGVNKAVVAARRIAELDPYLDLNVYPEGVTGGNLGGFLDGLDVLVEECDSLDLKVLLREEARRRGIPVLMETSDRGLLDVERFDLEPDRPLFHGLLGEVDSATLAGLSAEDKVPHVLRLVGAGTLSARLAASMVEVGRSLTTWPQLGGDVALGGATMAAAIRRLGTGRPLASGRLRIDLDEHLDGLAGSPEHDAHDRAATDGTGPGDQVLPSPRAADDEPGGGRPRSNGHPAMDGVLEAIRRAPSGGNVQPWRVEVDRDEVRLLLDPERTTTMDVAFRGSYVALGAALFNARAAASAAAALGPVSLFPDPTRPDFVARLRLETGSEDHLTRCAARVGHRGTNRAYGLPRPVPESVVAALRSAADHEDGRVRLVEPGTRLSEAARAMAAADRVRYLTTTLHREMFAELVWSDVGPSDEGIESDTLGLRPTDLAKLAIAQRPEVMALLADWDAGAALGEDTRDRLASSSALAVVTVTGSSPADFVRGGSAVESVWLTAEDRGLAVHPMSPVFLFAAEPGDLGLLSARFAGELATARTAFRAAVGLDEEETVALVMRLSHTEVKAPRSRRRPIVGVRTAT